MTASTTRAAMIRLSLATTTATAATPPAQRSVTTAWVIRSGWRPAQSGSLAATSTDLQTLPHRPDTSSAWNGFWRLIRSAAARAIRPKHLTLPSTLGSAPPLDGCSPDTLQAAVEAQAAAGIMMVVAAGNDGIGGCSTVFYPPAIYDASYTAGALVTGTDTIANFSSRGPVTIDGSGRIKPDITAPGTGTRSAFNTSDTAYGVFSGTSMATPHISGAIALLWSAIPSLKNQIAASRDAMNNAAHFISATQCGDPGPPNNVYGWGRVDIFAAVTGGTPTPTPTPTATPTPTGTPAPTPCSAWIAAHPCTLQRRGNVCCQRWHLCLCGRGLQQRRSPQRSATV